MNEKPSMRSCAPYLAVGILLLGTYGMIHGSTSVKIKDIAGLSMELPATIGDWKGTPAPVHPIERETLGADTEFSRKLYKNSKGDEIYLGIVLSGHDRSSIHPAEACLVGQGWKISTGEMVTIPIENPKPYGLEVMRLSILKPMQTPRGVVPVHSWYHYWFVGQNRLTASHYRRIFWSAYDRIISNVHHRWAYVTVMIQVRDGSEAKTDELIRDFMKQAVPTFQSISG